MRRPLSGMSHDGIRIREEAYLGPGVQRRSTKFSRRLHPKGSPDGLCKGRLAVRPALPARWAAVRGDSCSA